MFSALFAKGKTMKPLKPHAKGKQSALHDYSQATLGSGDVRAAVELPPGEGELEWIAMHVTDFFNNASLVYGTIADACTSDTCPTMSAGAKYEYLWSSDGSGLGGGGGRPVRCSAPEYVDRLLSWVDVQIRDESLFPTAAGAPFPKDFKARVAGPILRRLSRVFGHAYYHHFDTLLALGAEKHLNTVFKHFSFFVLHFGLVEKKELAPLAELVDTLTGGAFNVTAESGGSGTAGAQAPAVAPQPAATTTTTTSSSGGGGGGSGGPSMPVASATAVPLGAMAAAAAAGAGYHGGQLPPAFASLPPQSSASTSAHGVPGPRG